MAKEYWIFGVKRGCKMPVREGYEEPGRWSEKDQMYYPGKKHPPMTIIFNTFTGTAIIKDKVVADAIMNLRGFRSERNPGGSVWLVSHVVEDEKATNKPILGPKPQVKTPHQIVRGTRGTGSGKRKTAKVSKFTPPAPEVKVNVKNSDS